MTKFNNTYSHLCELLTNMFRSRVLVFTGHLERSDILKQENKILIQMNCIKTKTFKEYKYCFPNSA